MSLVPNFYIKAPAPVGAVLTFTTPSSELIKGRVEIQSSGCKDCLLVKETEVCTEFPCLAQHRNDGNNVVIKELKQLREIK